MSEVLARWESFASWTGRARVFAGAQAAGEFEEEEDIAEELELGFVSGFDDGFDTPGDVA